MSRLKFLFPEEGLYLFLTVDAQGQGCTAADWGSLSEGCISPSDCASWRAGLCFLVVGLPEAGRCLPSVWGSTHRIGSQREGWEADRQT